MRGLSQHAQCKIICNTLQAFLGVAVRGRVWKHYENFSLLCSKNIFILDNFFA